MSRRVLINTALTVLGIALLIWQVREVGGLAKIGEGLARVGWLFIVIVLLALGRFVLRSYAWLALLGEPAPLSSALAATLAGDAIGNLTPLGLAASEPAKALYLGKHVDRGRALAALTAENFFYSVSIAIYIVIGLVAMLLAFDHLPDEVQTAGIASLALMAVILIGAGWIAWQRPAAASAILTKLPSRRLRALADRVRAFETQTYGSAGHEGSRLFKVALTETAFHVVSFTESWLMLWLLTDGQSLPLEALILDSVNRVINVTFKLIPMRVGVDEATAETIAVAIGLMPAVGLMTALVRKLRMLVLAAAGLALLTRRTKRN